jgi:FMN-dependent NADH-azoreductase
MTNVLLLTSSPRGEVSLSTRVAAELAHKIDGARVTVRDLARNPLPNIGSEFIQAVFTPRDSRTQEQRDTLALSDELTAELLAADIVIIGTGMFNFGMPALLKTWIDHVTRAGLTFRYTESGPEGLVQGKKTILVLAMGGIYSSGPMAAMNHLEPHLRTSLAFIGMSDVETVVIEGTALGQEATDKALAAARARVSAFSASYAA